MIKSNFFPNGRENYSDRWMEGEAKVHSSMGGGLLMALGEKCLGNIFSSNFFLSC